MIEASVYDQRLRLARAGDARNRPARCFIDEGPNPELAAAIAKVRSGRNNAAAEWAVARLHNLR